MKTKTVRQPLTANQKFALSAEIYIRVALLKIKKLKSGPSLESLAGGQNNEQ